MILGAGIYQVPLIQKAKEMGLETIVVSIPGNYPGFAFADKVYKLDTRDQEAVLRAAQRERIDGICTSGTDVAVVTIGYVCEKLGLPGISIINTPAAIVLGMVYNFLPFMVLPVYNVLVKIDDNTINAAKDLGANEFQTFIHVWLPLSLPGIVSGVTMVFVPALTTFVISNLLGGSKILLIGNVIEQEFTKGSNWHLGSGLSLVLMVFILISMALIAKYDKNGEGTAF